MLASAMNEIVDWGLNCRIQLESGDDDGGRE